VDTEAAKAAWTPARMRAAQPLSSVPGTGSGTGTATSAGPVGAVAPGSGARVPGEAPTAVAAKSAELDKGRNVLGRRWRGGGGVAKSVGKLFFTTRGRDAVCSASVVAGLRADLVLTAGHCVFNRRWATNVAFVPGYRNGKAPYGIYPAQRLWTTRQWVRRADWRYDVAYIDLGVNGRDQQAGRVVGTQGVAFAKVRKRVHTFGYPAARPYNGETLSYCSARAGRDKRLRGRTYRMRCNLTAGASGGPWLAGFRPRTGIGYAVSVNSYKYRGDRNHVQGPVLGRLAELIYVSLQPVARNGTFVRNVKTGRFYRMAGGAPLDMRSWAPFGGRKKFHNVLPTYLTKRLRKFPADGTFIRAAQTGRVYRVALGAPIYVGGWPSVGGEKPTVLVDNYAVARHKHLRMFAGTGFIRGYASGKVYRVVDGHPYWIHSWDPWGGQKRYTDLDQVSIDACDHLRCGPFGGIGAVKVRTRTIRLTGWAMDPNSESPVRVRLVVDGKVRASAVASRTFAGLDGRFHRGNGWGFRLAAKVADGKHKVCAVANNVGRGRDGRVGCRTVRVR
jgi:V8-like Glu-specific endopeptidase